MFKGFSRQAFRNQSMKVLTISASDYTVGGAARVAWDLHRAAVIQDASSRMYTGKKCSDDATVVKIRRPLYTKALSYFLANDIDFFRTDYLLRSPEFLSADIVHCHNLNGWFFNLGTMIKMSKIKPVIWTLHDMWALTPHSGHTTRTEEIKNGLFKCSSHDLYPITLWDNDWYLSRRKNRLYAQGDFHVVTPCYWLKELVGKTCLSPKFFDVIPNGIDTDTFKMRDRMALKKSLGFDETKPLVLFIGSSLLTNPFKGFSDFCWLADDWPNQEVSFVALGAEDDGSYGKVKLIRAVLDKRKVSEYLSSADVLVLSSHHEVFPLVILEALASGVPVVAYDVGGVREAIEGLPACRTVPLRDKASLSKKLKESLDEFTSNSERISAYLRSVAVEKYSSSVMVKAYFELYKRILDI
jgi:glycosyltransferase involved in cell wall biosynthesis